MSNYITEAQAKGSIPDILRDGVTGQPKLYTRGGDFALGDVTFGQIQVQDETITLDGIYVSFTSAASDGAAAGTALDPLLVNIKGSLDLTLDELVIVLQATANATIAVATYAKSGTTILTIAYDTVGYAANAYTLAASIGTVSAATLEGGQDTPDLLGDSENVQINMDQSTDQAFSISDGREFQRRTILLAAKGSANAVITPANFTDGTTITLDTALDYAQLQFLGGAWKVVGTQVATVA